MVIDAVSVRVPRTRVMVYEPDCVYVRVNVFSVTTCAHEPVPCACVTCALPSPQLRSYALHGVAMLNSTSTVRGFPPMPGVTTKGPISTAGLVIVMTVLVASCPDREPRYSFAVYVPPCVY